MTRFGRFELVEPLGTGGVAEVWRGRDVASGGELAVKRLLPQFAGDRQVHRRFLREAEVARRLDHPNIVRALEGGEVDGRPYLAMEWVAGEDLGRRLEREGRLAPDESWRIALAVARALAHAHARGVVHRDVKPQNVLLGGDAVKLTDFGLARVETLASLTGSSLLWGSPEYMAPEHRSADRSLQPRGDDPRDGGRPPPLEGGAVGSPDRGRR
jgi:serine/threonine protein kinase